MIAGLGIDIVEVERIARAMRRPRFARRVLTDRERELYQTPERIAGRWAAKEAITKCLGERIGYQQIEVLPDASGAPVVRLQGRPAPILLSISHERSAACAIAIRTGVVDLTLA